MQNLSLRSAHDGRFFPCFRVKISILKDAFPTFLLVSSILYIALYTNCGEVDQLQSEFTSTWITKLEIQNLKKEQNFLLALKKDQEDELLKLHKKVIDQSLELTRKESDIQKLEGVQDRLETLKKDQEDELKKLHQKVTNQSLELPRKESDIQRLEGEQDRLETLKKNQENELKKLYKNVSDQVLELTEKKIDIQKLKEEQNRLEILKIDHENESQTLCNELTEKEKDIQSLQNELAGARRQNSDYKEDLENNTIKLKGCDKEFKNEQHKHIKCNISLKYKIDKFDQQLQEEREALQYNYFLVGISTCTVILTLVLTLFHFLYQRS